MPVKWIKTQYPGLRYYKHPERKHNGKKDRYYVIRYKRHGKAVEEKAGWASHGMNAQKANLLRAEIMQNIREGKRPQSLAERRQIEYDRKKAEDREKQLKEKENVTFDLLADEFLKWSEANKKDYCNDQSRYKNHIGPFLKNTLAKNVSPLMLEKFKRKLQKKDLAPKTIHHCLTLIRSIFNKAIIWQLYSGPVPTKDVKFPKVDNKRLRFLSLEEMHSLLDKLKEKSGRAHDQALISSQCGLRFKEIAKLTRADIDLPNGIIQVRDPKGHSRPAYITEPVKEIFETLFKGKDYKPDDLIFPDKNGKQQVHVSNTFYRTVKDMGFNDGVSDRRQKVCFHTLRHSFASWLAVQGESPFTLKELMGHKDLKMTERYTHLMPNVKRSAVDKLSDTFKENKPKNKKKKVVNIKQSK